MLQITKNKQKSLQQNDLKGGDSIILEPAVDAECVVTAVDGNIVILSLKDAGYAEGSKVFVKKGREKFEERKRK